MATNNDQQTQKKGRGWHSDPEGHRRAGRLGGLMKGRRAREARSSSEESPNQTDFTETSANS